MHPQRFAKTALSALTIAALLASAALAAVAESPFGAGGQSADAAASRTGPNLARAVVLLQGEPTATAVGAVHGPEANAYRAQLAAQRAEYRAWLAANVPQARVVWEYDTVLNGLSVDLRGASAAALRGGPGARQVLHPTWMSPTMDASLPLIEWGTATGQDPAVEGSTVGQGVFIAIIDSGIDQTHDFFRDDVDSLYKDPDGNCVFEVTNGGSTPNQTQFTNCKVVVAKVFHPSETSAEDVISHGTHVAGTSGGNSGTVTTNTDNAISGVAPAAFLGNYNVFPGTAGSASSDDIARAVEEAVLDGVHVMNLSLGGTPGMAYDVLDLALRSAADVGILAAVAAGNSGPGASTVESPGWAPWVLTAGASTNPHFEGQTADAADLGPTGAAVGEFATFPDPPVTLPYVWWDTIDGRRGTGLACESRPLRNQDLTGKIALIARGECTFTTKIRNAEAINAAGVIIFNNVAGDPIAMGHDLTDPFPTIPAVMVSQAYGQAMTQTSGANVTVGGPITEQDGTADIMAGFSSRGPANTPDGLLIKPDMVAPGVNVNSSIVCDEDGCGFAFFQGTSMATPHLAGAAAAVIWARDLVNNNIYGNQRDEVVKSILVNNSLDETVTDHVTGAALVAVNDEGAGRLLMTSAFGATFFADPVSFSFGQQRGTTATRSVTLSGDFAGATATATVNRAGVTATAEVVGDQVNLTITRPRNVRGDVEGIVTVTNAAGKSIHLAWWVRF